MSDEPNPNPTNPTTPTEPPMPNTTEAREPDGTLKDASSPTAPKEETSSGAPEAYTDFKVPEGSELDKEIIDKALPLFKELNLPQEHAQKLVDFYNDINKASAAKLETVVQEMRTAWRNEAKADKDIGPKLDSVITEIGRAKDKLPEPIRNAFNQAMDLTGAGDHPAIVKGIYELARLVNEGTHVAGKGPSVESQSKDGKVSAPSLAGAMYPHLSR